MYTLTCERHAESSVNPSQRGHGLREMPDPLWHHEAFSSVSTWNLTLPNTTTTAATAATAAAAAAAADNTAAQVAVVLANDKERRRRRPSEVLHTSLRKQKYKRYGDDGGGVGYFYVMINIHTRVQVAPRTKEAAAFSMGTDMFFQIMLPF